MHVFRKTYDTILLVTLALVFFYKRTIIALLDHHHQNRKTLTELYRCRGIHCNRLNKEVRIKNIEELCKFVSYIPNENTYLGIVIFIIKNTQVIHIRTCIMLFMSHVEWHDSYR